MLTKRTCGMALLVAAIAGCAGANGLGGPEASPSQLIATTGESPSATMPSSSPYASPTDVDPSIEPPGSPGAGPEGDLFADPEGAYQMTIPRDWQASHGSLAQGIEVWFTAPLADGFRPNVNVLTQAIGELSLDEYTQLSLDNAPSFIGKFELVDSRTEFGAHGTELAVSEYRGTTGVNRLLSFVAVWTVHDGQAIVATLTSTPETYEAQREAWLPYLLTLSPT